SRPPPEPAFEALLHRGPVVVDHGVPRGVAPFAAADEHVLAEDALELRRERRERRPRPLIRGIRLELDPEVALVLEGAPHQEVLRLLVRAGPPRLRSEPRVADLHDAVVGAVVEEARVADELALEVVGEAGLHRVEPRLEHLTAFVAAHAHQRPDPW